MNDAAGDRCLLIIEDEMQLAMLLEDVVAGAGHQVMLAARLPAALRLAQTAAIDGAILDINLAGERVYPVADVLQRREIPFVFASGYGEADLPARYRRCPMLRKPYGVEQLHHALATLLGEGATPLAGGVAP